MHQTAPTSSKSQKYEPTKSLGSTWIMRARAASRACQASASKNLSGVTRAEFERNGAGPSANTTKESHKAPEQRGQRPQYPA
mmetsp:Transcript_106540/g.211673  ORF Transcript_106540/g.211673 Transcript_106540/m.211673 type:complete len:82 (+) Transcript_106540:1729-1974(+)